MQEAFNYRTESSSVTCVPWGGVGWGWGDGNGDKDEGKWLKQLFSQGTPQNSAISCRVPRGAASSFLLWNVCSPSPMRLNGNLELCERFTGMLPLWDHRAIPGMVCISGGCGPHQAHSRAFRSHRPQLGRHVTSWHGFWSQIPGAKPGHTTFYL